MPFSAWSNADLTLTPWRLVALSVCILVLRRLPGIFALQWCVFLLPAVAGADFSCAQVHSRRQDAARGDFCRSLCVD